MADDKFANIIIPDITFAKGTLAPRMDAGGRYAISVDRYAFGQFRFKLFYAPDLQFRLAAPVLEA